MREEKVHQHPSYGTIQIFRTSGLTRLFDSEFDHQHYITLKICEAELCGDSTHEMLHAKKRIIEVCMSESQFARAITSVNMGSGSACTLTYANGERREEPPKRVRKEIHSEMVEEKLQGELEKLSEISEKLTKWREEKHRPTLKEVDELAREMRIQSEQFASNMAFYAKTFEEHMEKIVDSAKAEIETHVLMTTERLGVAENPLKLED